MPWTDLVFTAVALVVTMNLLTVLLVARAHQNERAAAPSQRQRRHQSQRW